jgi:hypothetical protein
MARIAFAILRGKTAYRKFRRKERRYSSRARLTKSPGGTGIEGDKGDTQKSGLILKPAALSAQSSAPV